MTHKSEDYKLSAVRYYLESGKSQQDICDIFKCSSRSLMRWVDRYDNTGSIKRQDRKPIAYKVRKEWVKSALKYLNQDKTLTTEDLLVKLKREYPDCDITRRHLHTIIKDNNISLKLTRYRHEPTKRFGKDVDINKNLKDFYKTVKAHSLKDIICIDETSINALQNRKFCYETVGKRCVLKTTSQQVFKRYTAIFAIDSQGVIAWEIYEKGGINSDKLYSFIESNIVKKHKGKLVILDNASSHRTENIKQLVSADNTILYSVPYQHYTNAIEGFFNVLKSRLQKVKGNSYAELKTNISKVVKSIPEKIYGNLLKGAYERDEYYVKPVLGVKRASKNYK